LAVQVLDLGGRYYCFKILFRALTTFTMADITDGMNGIMFGTTSRAHLARFASVSSKGGCVPLPVAW
jgi:hypothetical protein